MEKKILKKISQGVRNIIMRMVLPRNWVLQEQTSPTVDKCGFRTDLATLTATPMCNPHSPPPPSDGNIRDTLESTSLKNLSTPLLVLQHCTISHLLPTLLLTIRIIHLGNPFAIGDYRHHVLIGHYRPKQSSGLFSADIQWRYFIIAWRGLSRYHYKNKPLLFLPWYFPKRFTILM